ncbi:cobalamin B12-binding domain-containing protein [Actinokineospora sp. NPDC004072]
MTSAPATTSPAAVDVPALRERLWEAALAGDEYAAVDALFAAVDAGLDPEAALLEVIAPVQARVGVEWAANRISVAGEHAATAINDRVIAALAHHPAARRAPDRGAVAVACVDGEWHALPARLLAEVLRLRGWRVDFLGAQVPTPHLITHLHQRGPEAVALSVSIPTRLPAAHAAITACQATGVPVIAGGPAFGSDGRYARLLGADGWAPDARAAADQLAAGVAPPAPGVAHQPVDVLPHLVDQEYTLVTRSAPQLVRHTIGALPDSDPDELARLVDFLASALYVDDEALLTEHVAWSATILGARESPTTGLASALDLLAAQLTDFPRATRMLTAARHTLDDPA